MPNNSYSLNEEYGLFYLLNKIDYKTVPIYEFSKNANSSYVGAVNRTA